MSVGRSAKDIPIPVKSTQPMVQVLVREGEGWQKDTVHVEITAWDFDGEAGVQSLVCYVGQQEVCNLQRKNGESSQNLTANLTVSQESLNGEGTLLTVRASDFVGNIREVSKWIYIDRTAPSIILETGGKVQNTSAQIRVSVTDNNLVSEQHTEIKFKNLEGKEQRIELPPEGILTEEGSYTITVKALDGAGNTTQVTKQVVIDKTPPEVRYVQHMENTVIPVFQWNYKEEEVVWDYLETKEKILLDGEEFRIGEKIADEGRHELVVEAVDLAGNQKIEKASFLIDCTPPEIQIQNIENGGIYKKGHTFSIWTEEKGEWLTNICLNGRYLTLEKNTKIFEYSLLEPGEYSLEAEAQDAARNQSKKEIVFRVVSDLEEPMVDNRNLTRIVGIGFMAAAVVVVVLGKKKKFCRKSMKSRNNY